MEVIWVVADTVPSSGKGVRYGAFDGGGVTAMVVEVLLGVGSVPGEVDGILTVELFQEISKGVGSMGPE